ncbi:MAG: glycoside hydrolase family 57 protein [Desulfovibrio sp.]|nr:glycoside hydrolase family 57 protein [Desulfovibrio sp.]
MAAICLCLAIHEPYYLRRYTIFDVAGNSLYEDDDRSCNMAMQNAQSCYLPTNEILYRLIQRFKGDFRIALSVSGSALDLFEQYTPEVIDSLKALAETGCVEFISESGPHSLACLYSKEEFVHQVQEHTRRIRRTFGKIPNTFRNSELLYGNDLAQVIEQLGFSTVLTEGSPQLLGWRNANFVYASSVAPQLHLLLRNADLSTDISQRFSQKSWDRWPLTADTFAGWCAKIGENADTINLFLDFHVFGLRNTVESGIFSFLEALPQAILQHKHLHFLTPRQIIKKYPVSDTLAVAEYQSWNDEGCDLKGWLGNEMQKDAIKELYSLAKRIRSLGDENLLHDFERLQTSDYFHYMSTRWFSESQPDRPNPYHSPYDAYISYMNITSDLTDRLTKLEEAKRSSRTLRNKAASSSQTAKAQNIASAKKTSVSASGEKKPTRKRSLSKSPTQKRVPKKTSR